MYEYVPRTYRASDVTACLQQRGLYFSSDYVFHEVIYIKGLFSFFFNRWKKDKISTHLVSVMQDLHEKKSRRTA